jgi:predicted glycoside hydrolase/deacetylase ChbG (UPF0249 family)
MQPIPLLAKLGYPPDARLVIFHADDVGMCHGSNRAFVELFDAGIVRSGSIMACCPWAPEMLAIARRRPELDLGVHLTLTSEWPGYRWGPLTTRDPASGLVDAFGCFWPNLESFPPHLDVALAKAELRAQVELVRQAGVDFTHVDAHMAAALLPPFLPTYVELGLAYGAAPFILRTIDPSIRARNLTADSDAQWVHFVAGLEARGVPLIDHFRITPGYGPEAESEDRAALYERILHDLPPGITYFSLHPNAPGDIETIALDHAPRRLFEYEYFQSERLRRFLAEEGIVPIGYRALRAMLGDVT